MSFRFRVRHTNRLLAQITQTSPKLILVRATTGCCTGFASFCSLSFSVSVTVRLCVDVCVFLSISHSVSISFVFVRQSLLLHKTVRDDRATRREARFTFRHGFLRIFKNSSVLVSRTVSSSSSSSCFFFFKIKLFF